MKYIVLSNFIDKKTKETQVKGKTIELTDERAKEILEVGKFIEKVEVPTKTEEPAKAEPAKKTTTK